MASFLQAVGLQLVLEPASSAVVCRTACAVVGLLYPMYQSFKAIEAPPLTQHRDKEQWLTYWGVNGALSMAERLLKARGLPFYYHLKLLFLLWLQLPSFQGARRLYEDFMRPYILTHQRQVDDFLYHLGSSTVQPEVMAFCQRIRTAAKKVPLLGYFAQSPDEWHHD